MAATDETGADGGATRSRLVVAGAIAGGLALSGLAALWIERKPIVVHYADAALRDRHVPARYRIAAIGPFAQRLEDVSIGDPKHPDLVARSVELHLVYGVRGPHLVAVRADGVRLSARVADGRLSLGAIDRLLPKTSGNAPVALPPIAVTLDDAIVRLATPAGPIVAHVDGDGRLSDGFRGHIRAAASELTLGGCTLDGASADVAVTVAARRPHLTGPVALAGLACPGLSTGAGRATIDLELAATLDRWRGGVRLAGFAGRAGAMRFGALSGSTTVTGSVRRIGGEAQLAVAHPDMQGASAAAARLDGRYRYAPGATGLVYAGDLSLDRLGLAPARRRAIAAMGDPLAGTPLGPVASRAALALADAARDADATMTIAATAGGRAGAGVRVRRLDLVAASGARVRVAEGGGFGWNVAEHGWRADGRVTADGGGLPALDMALRQPRAGATLSGIARIAPYAAGPSRLTLGPIRFARGQATRFATVATIDGPVAGGRVEGLSVPLVGRIGGGDMVVDAGCVAVGFRSLALAGARFSATRLSVCGIDGRPAVAMHDGAVTAGIAIARPRLTGTTGSSPLTLSAERVRVDTGGLAVEALAAQIGHPDATTRLDVAHLDGRFSGGLGGRFAGLGGQIANVPLVMTGGAGGWALAGGTLSLDGGLTVSDAAASPRFKPMAARDVRLTLTDGVIRTTGDLAEPVTGERVADVTIRHDLTDGRGNAAIAVPGILFDRRLQPEMLTPLTLGVVANVAGTVAGSGRIIWGPSGVTSTGAFATDRIDLAAAFGPVTGIRGTIRFSDLLGLVTAPDQTLTVAEINPGVAVTDGRVRYRILPGQRIAVEDARWPFAHGTLTLAPTVLDFADGAERRMTFTLRALDAAAFVQDLDVPNLAATGTFDGVLPMIFDQTGGRISGGEIRARPPGGTLAYVGELSREQLGTMGKLAFDALKAIRYTSLSIALDGRLDGEIVSRVAFTGVREATPDASLAARLIHDLPFRFNISIRAPFRALAGTARSYADPTLLLPLAGKGVVATQVPAAATSSAIQPPAIKAPESEPVR